MLRLAGDQGHFSKVVNNSHCDWLGLAHYHKLLNPVPVTETCFIFGGSREIENLSRRGRTIVVFFKKLQSHDTNLCTNIKWVKSTERENTKYQQTYTLLNLEKEDEECWQREEWLQRKRPVEEEFYEDASDAGEVFIHWDLHPQPPATIENPAPQSFFSNLSIPHMKPWRLRWYNWLAWIQSILLPIGRTTWPVWGKESYGFKHLPEGQGKGSAGLN